MNPASYVFRDGDYHSSYEQLFVFELIVGRYLVGLVLNVVALGSYFPRIAGSRRV